MKKDGMNTAITQSMASSRGMATSRLAREDRGARLYFRRDLEVHVDVFEEDRALIDKNADRPEQSPPQRHDVDRLSSDAQRDDRA